MLSNFLHGFDPNHVDYMSLLDRQKAWVQFRFYITAPDPKSEPRNAKRLADAIAAIERSLGWIEPEKLKVIARRNCSIDGQAWNADQAGTLFIWQFKAVARNFMLHPDSQARFDELCRAERQARLEQQLAD